MLEAFKKHIDENLSFLQGKKLLVTCSGGLDSVVLTELLHRLDFTPGLAHCNFQLRAKESDEDAEFVQALAERLGLPVYIEQFETGDYARQKGISIQMAARQLRYLWFEEIATDFKYDYILTAHHLNDDLETFLINLSRGTGIRGLSGIPQLQGKIVRPLLPFSRKQLLEFAKSERLYWREDSSNESDDYLRNDLRHNVIPPFEKAAGNVLKGFQSTRNNLLMSERLIEDYLVLIRALVISQAESDLIFDIPKLQDLPNTAALLYELLQPYGFTSWDDVSDLLNAQSGKYILSPSHRLVKDREVLILSELENSEMVSEVIIESLPFRLEDPIRVNFSEVDEQGISDSNTVYVDKNALQFPLKLRKWKDGDYFFPFGMKGKKKVSKFFKDEKLSLVAKEKTWLLTSGDDIVWVVGMRLDDRFRITDKTTTLVQLKSDQ